MPSLLLFQALLQSLHQLVPSTQRFDLRFFFFAEKFFREFSKPFLGDIGRQHRIKRLDPLKIGGESSVEAIKIGFVLHQANTRQVIKIIHIAMDDALVHCFAKGQIFSNGNRQAALLQRQEKIDQHRCRSVGAGRRLTAAL